MSSPPPAVTVSVLGEAESTCTTSYILAIYYLVMGIALIIIPWAFSGSGNIFTFTSAFIVNVIGVLVFVGAIAHIYYISRIVRLRGKCDCP